MWRTNLAQKEIFKQLAFNERTTNNQSIILDLDANNLKCLNGYD